MPTAVNTVHRRLIIGTKPGDLPLDFPAKIELVINLTTAQSLGLDGPASVLARAEVIE